MLIRLSLLTLAALTFACSHSNPPSQELAAQAAPDCKADTMCTREYQPTTCRFLDNEFKSSNPCEAKKLARSFACERGTAFDENKVTCVPDGGSKTQ